MLILWTVHGKVGNLAYFADFYALRTFWMISLWFFLSVEINEVKALNCLYLYFFCCTFWCFISCVSLFCYWHNNRPVLFQCKWGNYLQLESPPFIKRWCIRMRQFIPYYIQSFYLFPCSSLPFWCFLHRKSCVFNSTIQKTSEDVIFSFKLIFFKIIYF